MLNENFVYVGAFLSVAASVPYVWGVLRGDAKPNRVTWSVWTLSAALAFAGEVDEGVGVQAVSTLAAAVGPGLVLAASFVNPKASWAVRKLDVVCGVTALVGLALWMATGEGESAIAFSLGAVTAAAIPTFIKAHRHPETESALCFVLVTGNAIIRLLTIDRWDFANTAYALHMLAMSGALAAVILLARRVSQAETVRVRGPARST